MVSLCSAHQDAPNYIHDDFEVTLRSCDLKSTVDFDRMKSSHRYIFLYFHIMLLFFSKVTSKVIGKNNSFVLKCCYFNCFDPGDIVFDLTFMT